MSGQNSVLTGRQQAVCDLLIQGFSNKEISARLGISHRTVEVHRSEVFRKMSVRNAVELVRVSVLTEREGIHG